MLLLNHTVVPFTMGRVERVHIACFMLENCWKFLIWKGGLQKRTGIHRRDGNERNFFSGMLPSLVRWLEVPSIVEAVLPCQHPSVVWGNTNLGGWKQLLSVSISKTNLRGLAPSGSISKGLMSSGFSQPSSPTFIPQIKGFWYQQKMIVSILKPCLL